MDVLSDTNIKSGWKLSGLWPVNMSKPLISRYLLANNALPVDRNNVEERTTPMSARGARLEDYGYELPQLKTHKKVGELRGILRPQCEATTAERYLFRKTEKVFD